MGKGGGCGSSSEAERLQEEKERAEQERVANLPSMSVNFISPPPAIKFEFNVEEAVEGALEALGARTTLHVRAREVRCPFVAAVV